MLSPTLIDRVKRHEGLVLTPQRDVGDMWVIGWGHDILPDQAVALAHGISDEEAENWLHEDLENAEHACRRSFSWFDELSPIRQEVIIEMCFQMGMLGLTKFRKMLMCASAGDYAGAAAQMLDSEWYRETPARCKELSNNMRWGKDSYATTT